MNLHGRREKDAGFTLIELLVVIIVIAILAAIAIPLFLGQREKAVQTECLTARAHADRAQVIYIFEHGTHTEDCADLVAEGLIDEIPACPSGGTLAWVSTGSGYRLDCSAHGQLAAAPATPLGSSFADISSGLIHLIDSYYQKNGNYPRTWGEYAWTDIGLDPADWQDPAGNLTYKPVGSRINVAPAAGHAIDVKMADGTSRTLTDTSNWNLVYSAETGQWYYHSINPGNVVDINTMVVRER